MCIHRDPCTAAERTFQVIIQEFAEKDIYIMVYIQPKIYYSNIPKCPLIYLGAFRYILF